MRVAGTAVPALLVRVKLTVLDCTASLKVAESGDDTATPAAPASGVWLATAGWTVAVVNDHETGALMATPVLFSAPLTVAV